jgi:acyl carrier protein
MSDLLRTQLQKIMAESFGIPIGEIPPSPTPDNTRGWDSLSHIDLIETLELQFSIEINHADSVTLLSEDDIVSYLAERNINASATTN